MEILNVGPWEFFFIILIALIVLGPDNMVKTGRTMGRWVYRLIRSPLWAQIMDTSRELRNLPTKIVREAGLEESLKDIKEETKTINSDLSNDLRKAADEVNAAARDVSGPVAFASPGPQNANSSDPAAGGQGDQHEKNEDSPISPPMQEGDETPEQEPGSEQTPTDTPADRVIPREGAKVAPAIIEVGDTDEIREEMVEESAEHSLEKPRAEEDIDNPTEEDVPPPAIIDVDKAASFGDTFIEPFEESTLVEDQEEDAFPDQPLEERPVEQWRERIQQQQQKDTQGEKKNNDRETGKDNN